MSVIIDGVEDTGIFPTPEFGKYKPARQAPKDTFQADSGYPQQREKYPTATYKVEIEWDVLSTDERADQIDFLNDIGSDLFYYVIPTAARVTGEGTVTLQCLLCRVTSDNVPDEPKYPGPGGPYWHMAVTLQSVGGIESVTITTT